MARQRQLSRSRGSGRGQSQRTLWENLAFDVSLTAAASITFATISPEPLALLNIGTAKLLRLIGKWSGMAVGNSTQTAFLQGFMGFAVVNRDAAISSSALPNPASDFQQSWYYWDMLSMSPQTTTGFQIPEQSFDIRTSRLLRSGYDLIVVWENVTQELPVELSVSMRLLWQVY